MTPSSNVDRLSRDRTVETVLTVPEPSETRDRVPRPKLLTDSYSTDRARQKRSPPWLPEVLDVGLGRVSASVFDRVGDGLDEVAEAEGVQYASV